MQNVKPRPSRARSRTGQPPAAMRTVKETAAYLGCSDMHIYRLIAAGDLPTVDIAGPTAKRPKVRIRSDDLADYIDRKTRGIARPAGRSGDAA